MVCFGELSLAGEVRPVSFSDRRLKSAVEMGFTKAVVAMAVDSKLKIQLAKCGKIREAFKL